MLDYLNAKLHEVIIDIVLHLHCGHSVTTIGAVDKSNNCFWVGFQVDDQTYFGIESFAAGNFVCQKFTNHHFNHLEVFSPLELINQDLQFTHFNKHHRIKISGLYLFLITFLPKKLCSTVFQYIEEIEQFIFNKRSLSSRKRVSLLRLLVENFITNREGFSYIEVMQLLYSNKVFLHPSFDSESSKIVAILDGFTQTKELELVQHKYKLTGHAFKSLADYEEEDRRHKEMTLAQWVLIVVTFSLLIATLIQAQVIKVPTIVDLTN